MDIFEEAEMELGCEPGELRGTFPAGLIDEVIDEMLCQHEDVTPHRTWDSGQWYWTCNDCYNFVSNHVVTDRMRKAEEDRNG